MIKRILNVFLIIVLMFNFTCISFADNELDESVSMYTSMQELYFDKKYDECIKFCQQITDKDDMFMDAYYYLAMSAFYSGKTELAYDTLLKQIDLNPNNELALYNAACGAALIGEIDKSVELVERLISLDITQKQAIKNDADFDNIRNNEKYKRLMEISVIVGGELIEFDVAPVIIDGRTLLPMRKIFECLGATVTYDDKTSTAIAVKDDLKIEITISNNVAKVNGEEKELDVPAMIIDDRTMVPVRFISEALLAEVSWDGENEVVDIKFQMPEGDFDYESAKSIIDNNSIVSVVDGIFPEPYLMNREEGLTMIILKDKETLSAFDALSRDNKSKYVNETVYDNYALVVGCSPVYARVIYDGKVFYEGQFIYDNRDELMEFTYYANGKKTNVVKQFKSKMNYIDFNLLSEEEQTTSSIGD